MLKRVFNVSKFSNFRGSVKLSCPECVRVLTAYNFCDEVILMFKMSSEK